jgi:hypothetical protein
LAATPPSTATPPPAHRTFDDPWVYRLAVGGVGLALVAFLIGAAIVGADGQAKDMFSEYWTIGAALSGALVGIVAPSPTQQRAHAQAATPGGPGAARRAFPLLQPVLLMAALALCLWLATEVVREPDAATLRTLGAGAGGALLGLLAPSPGGKPL